MTSQTNIQSGGAVRSEIPIRSNNSFLDNIQNNNASAECPMLVDSFINNTMMYNSDSPIRDCTTPIAMCLLQFTGMCDGNICFGVYCAYHHQLMSMRQFIGMTNEDQLTSRVCSVSQTRMHGRQMHIITSIIPVGENLSFFETWTKDLTNIPHDERATISKFFTLLCNHESACTSNAEHALLKQYVAEVTAYAFNLVRGYQNQLININMALNLTKTQIDKLLLRSKWFKNVHQNEFLQKVEYGPQVDGETVWTYYIPIMMFNVFDILNFMTYNLEPSLQNEGYLPNCELTYTHIIHGNNYGVFNSVETYNNTNKQFNYSPQLNAAVNQQVTARVTNLDVLSLFCTSDNIKTVDYIEVPCALLKSDTCAKFNLSAINAPQLFKYR